MHLYAIITATDLFRRLNPESLLPTYAPMHPCPLLRPTLGVMLTLHDVCSYRVDGRVSYFLMTLYEDRDD